VAAAAALWLLLVLGLAGLGDPHSFWKRLAEAAAGTVAAVAFAITGLPAVASLVRRREWEKRTQYLAITLFERAQEELADLAVVAYRAFVKSLPEECRAALTSVRPAFNLPIAETQQRHQITAGNAIKALQEMLRRARDEESERHDAQASAKLADDLAQIYGTLGELRGLAARLSGTEADAKVAAESASEERTVGESSAEPPVALPQAAHDTSEQLLMVDISRALIEHADAAAVELRARWDAFDKTIGQLADLTDDADDAQRLHEGILLLRTVISQYGARDALSDGAGLAAKRTDTPSRLDDLNHAHDACVLVSQVLHSGFAMLIALHMAWRRRVNRMSPAALKNSSFGSLKEAGDWLADSEADLVENHRGPSEGVAGLRAAFTALIEERRARLQDADAPSPADRAT